MEVQEAGQGIKKLGLAQCQCGGRDGKMGPQEPKGYFGLTECERVERQAGKCFKSNPGNSSSSLIRVIGSGLCLRSIPLD